MGYYWITEAPALHPAPRLQRSTLQPSTSASSSLRIDQYRRRQLLLPRRHEQAHDHARQGRRRRRRGRRRDRPRVRPLGAGRPGAAAGTPPTRARSARRSATTLAVTVTQPYTPQSLWPCVADWDSTSYTTHDAALPAPHRRHQAVPGRPRRRVHADGEIWSSAAVRHEHRARARPRHQDHHRGAVRLHPDDLDARRRPGQVDYARKTDPRAVPTVEGRVRRTASSTT